MLSDGMTSARLKELLIPRSDWHPYPTVDERDAWEVLPQHVRTDYLGRGEAALGTEWPTLPATLFLEFQREGNRDRYEHVNHLRRLALRDLVLAEALEGQGRFLDDIVNGIWTTCEETYWGYPAHVDVQRAGVGLPDVEEPTVDLFAAETVAQLGWTLYLLGERLDTVSPLVRRRVVVEAQRRVLDPCLARDDFWWMGFDPGSHGVNNWNPWVNSNWLTAVLLLEEDEGRRAAALAKILRSLDIFVGTYAESGGCDEGPGYWGRAAASLFDCLDLLHSATAGGMDVYDQPKIRNMGAFIYRTHIHDDYFVNFADASAVTHPTGSLVTRYGRAVGDAEMASFGAWLISDSDDRGLVEGSLGRILPALFDMPDPLEVAPAQPLPRDAWFDGIQVMVARDVAGTAEGLFVAAKAGHNAESHNHNDVGNVIVYSDGKPVIVDAGVEIYRRQTFSPQRYEIWTMQSAYHTLLPTLGERIQQAPGRAFAARDVAYEADERTARLSLDFAGAYPAEAGVGRWQRTVTLVRGEELVVEDVFELRTTPPSVELGLLTPCDVDLASGSVTFRSTAFGRQGSRMTGAAVLTYESEVFEATLERISIGDARLGGVWGDHLYRVCFVATSPPRMGTWIWRVTALPGERA